MPRRPDPRIVWSVAAIGAASLGFVSYGVVSLFSRPGLPAGTVPPRPSAAPFAPVPSRVVWPVITNHDDRGEVGYVDVNGQKHGNQSRRFGAPRDGRMHAGIDLYGYSGDPVVAIADGTVVATQSYHLGSDAILVAHDGFVALYGEVTPGSWKEFGVGVGSKVRAGDRIARIACMIGTPQSCSSHMLHFETYVTGTTKNLQWHSSTPPAALLDPTYLLLVAAPAGVNV